MILSDEEIIEVLDQLSAIYMNDDRIYAVDSEDSDDETLFILKSYELLNLTSPELSVTLSGNETIVNITNKVGQGIRHDVFYEGIDHLDLDQSTIKHSGGGIIRPKGKNWYGTLGVSVYHFEITHRGTRCSGYNVIISNNHVIADNDALPIGQDIERKKRAWETIGDLHCYVPVTSGIPFDIALATLKNPNPNLFGKIYGIGKITGAGLPRRNSIVHKHGATSGYTTGIVKGISYISIDGHVYKSWRVTGSPFGCPGDSGSAVVDGLKFIGVYFAGDETDTCNQEKDSYLQSWDTISNTNSSTKIGVMLTVDDPKYIGS